MPADCKMKRIIMLTMVILAVLPRIVAGDMKVSILTCGPGSDVYELEGHTGLRFTDRERGIDTVVHWGLFDFNSPNFLYRFVKGETDYSIGELPAGYFLMMYDREGRSVTEQQLDLTQSESERLWELVVDNLRPGNRIYRYNYVKDNCATRPLRLLEQALGDTLTFAPMSNGDSVSTFRSEMTRYHRNYPWYQFGIDLALGSGLDYEITVREKAFAPVMLRDMLATATFGDRRIVRLTSVPVEGVTGGVAAGPTPWFLTPVAVSALMLLITLLVSLRDMRRRRVTRWFDSVFYGVMGIAGLLLTFLIFVSTHEASSPNWLYLWLNPFCLVVTIFIWLKKLNRVVFCYQIANFVALIMLLIVAALGVQVLNAAFILLIACDLVRSANYIYITRCERMKID